MEYPRDNFLLYGGETQVNNFNENNTSSSARQGKIIK